MSRVGNSPVVIPDGAEVQVSGQTVSAKGKLGELSVNIPTDIEVMQEDGSIVFKPRANNKRTRMAWGTSPCTGREYRHRCHRGIYQKPSISPALVIVPRYRARNLNLQLGFSHDVNFPIPEGITIACEGQTTVVISGADKQAVGQVAAKIRSYRKPEPYKGQGCSLSR